MFFVLSFNHLSVSAGSYWSIIKKHTSNLVISYLSKPQMIYLHRHTSFIYTDKVYLNCMFQLLNNHRRLDILVKLQRITN
jgi:hypothetical protein